VLFLTEQNKNRRTLEATDDLGTLTVDSDEWQRPLRWQNRCAT